MSKDNGVKKITQVKYINNDSEWIQDDSTYSGKACLSINEDNRVTTPATYSISLIALKRSPHPNLLVDHSVLSILVKFFLRVHVNPVGSQLFPDLEISNIKRKTETVNPLQFWKDTNQGL